MSEADDHTGIVLAAIIVLALLVRVLCFSGYTGSDDAAYAFLSHQMAHGTYQIQWDDAPVFPLRIGLLGPAALAFAVAGTNEMAMIAYPFVLSLASLILAFVAGRHFFNARVGLIAAALLAITPMDTRFASEFFPDLPAAFWANLGVVLVYLGSRRAALQTKIVYGIAAGMSLGLSWLCKETVVYLIPFLGLYLIWLGARDRRDIGLLCGAGGAFLAIVLAESAVYYRLTSDLAYRFHAAERNYEINKLWFFAEDSPFGWKQGAYWPAVVRRLFDEGPRALFLNGRLGLITAVSVVAIAYAALTRSGAFAVPAAWFGCVALMFNFGSSSLNLYRPLVLFDRYLYPVVLPAVILTAGLIDALGQSQRHPGALWRRTAAVGLLCAVVAVNARGTWSNIVAGRQSPAERTMSRLVAPSAPLYTDSRSAKVLRFFWKYPAVANTTDFSGMDTMSIPDGSYVLINRDRVDFLHSAYGYAPPRFYDDVPRAWRLKASDHRARLYWVPLPSQASLAASR